MKWPSVEPVALRYSSVDLALTAPSARLRVIRPVQNNDDREIFEVQTSDLLNDFGTDRFLMVGYTRDTAILSEVKSGAVSVFLYEHKLQPDGTVDAVKHKPRVLDKGLVTFV